MITDRGRERLDDLLSAYRGALDVPTVEEVLAALDEGEPEPVSIEAVEEWLDWGPGLGYCGRPGESPAQLRRRQATWPRWRRALARMVGWLV